MISSPIIKKREDGGLNLVEFFNYPEFDFPNIKHFFFTRNLVGTSHRYVDNELEKKYELETLKENRRTVSSHFQLTEKDISILKQFHTNRVEIVNEPWPLYKELTGDSLVTKRRNIILAVQTADCAPIFFADPGNKVIAAAHCGWRGSRSGILENTVSNLLELGAKKDNLIAAIGPCIHQDNYEISQDFYEHFLKESTQNEKFFRQSQYSYKYYFDLPGYITSKLSKLGVNVINHHLDTYSNPHNFFSYRRSKIEQGSLEGSLISAIVIRE